MIGGEGATGCGGAAMGVAGRSSLPMRLAALGGGDRAHSALAVGVAYADVAFQAGVCGGVAVFSSARGAVAARSRVPSWVEFGSGASAGCLASLVLGESRLAKGECFGCASTSGEAEPTSTRESETWCARDAESGCELGANETDFGTSSSGAAVGGAVACSESSGTSWRVAAGGR